MPGEIRGLFNTKYNSEILNLNALLEAKTKHFKEKSQLLMEADIVIRQAIQQIRQSYMNAEQKNQLIEAIDRLELILSAESDESIMITKYQALATMLNTVILSNNHDAIGKAEALDAYFLAFKDPSSKTKTRTSVFLIGGILALIIGLCVASHFLLPLIPFAAALTWMGLTGGWLVFGASVLATATQVGGLLLALWTSCVIAEKIINPLNELIQSFTKEYEVAVSIKSQIGSSLHFFTAEKMPPLLKPVEREEEFDLGYPGNRSLEV